MSRRDGGAPTASFRLRVGLKKVRAERAGESAGPDSYPGEVAPAFGTGLGTFVVADEAAVTHAPAEGAFDEPVLGPDLEALSRGAALHDLDDELGSVAAAAAAKSGPA